MLKLALLKCCGTGPGYFPCHIISQVKVICQPKLFAIPVVTSHCRQNTTLGLIIEIHDTKLDSGSQYYKNKNSTKQRSSWYNKDYSLCCITSYELNNCTVNLDHQVWGLLQNVNVNVVLCCAVGVKTDPLSGIVIVATYHSLLVYHYDDVIMTMLASQITSLTVVYSNVYSGVNQRKHQSSASLAFVREIHRGPVNFPHKWPVTRKMFPFDDVIMILDWVYRYIVL